MHTLPWQCTPTPTHNYHNSKQHKPFLELWCGKYSLFENDKLVQSSTNISLPYIDRCAGFAVQNTITMILLWYNCICMQRTNSMWFWISCIIIIHTHSIKVNLSLFSSITFIDKRKNKGSFLSLSIARRYVYTIIDHLY